MCKMYTIIEQLCQERGIRPGKLCTELGISRGTLSDLKAGRTRRLSAENLEKIAHYFSVSTDQLLGASGEKTNAPTESGERRISDEELKFALWGDCTDVDDDDLDDVRRYAAFVRERKKAR